MSSGETTNRGASIIPSARKSIHSHLNRPLSTYSIMTRYGLSAGKPVGNPTANAVGSQPAPSHAGVDEVDNVLSKPLPLSPSPRRHILKRRNSHTPDYSEDSLSEDVAHSKSLPATLSPYYSEDYFHGSFENRTHESSQPDISWSTNRSQSFSSDESFPRERSIRKEKHEKGKGSSMNIVFAASAALTVALAIYNLKDVRNSETVNYDEHQYSHDLQHLGGKYKITFDSIKVQSGIATIFSREDSGSFIFLYDSKSSNFIQNDFDNFINDLATKTAKYLRNKSEGVEYLAIDRSDLISVRTHSEFMNNYQEQVDKTGVMLVKEMDRVPSDLAMAFHYYCDEYNPLVKKSAIFFTLDVGKCSDGYDFKTVHALVERCLANKWTGVPQDNIGPLLTRVVSVVVDVTT